MAILIDENIKVLVQGITGSEGHRATQAMREYGTKVVAGVTPGKGGQHVEGIPVYDTIKEAMEQHEMNASVIYVPPFAVKDAAFEAISNNIKLVNCITEEVPIRDTVEIVAHARSHGVAFVGPSSIGIMNPETCRLGMIGGPKELADTIYKKGNIGVISKSGGMTNETSWVVRQAGLGQSTVVGIGGDIIIGITFADLLELFEGDKETKGVVIFGELGGTYEEEVAEMIKEGRFTKPVATFVAGKFAQQMPEGMAFGHAGALIQKGKGTPEAKMKMLREAGVITVEEHHELGEAIKNAI